ncbi:hypothetical protein AB6C54_18630 [Vibrio splendidus]
MPELNPKGYSKLLNSGGYEELPIISEQYEVVDDTGIPVPLKFSHHERTESIEELPDGFIIISAVDFEDEEQAEKLFEEAKTRHLQSMELYDFIMESYDDMYEESVIGRVAFNILPGPISVKELTTVPRICGAYLLEGYRQLRISPLCYQIIGQHYGAVQSDQEQTVLGAKLWFASLPRFGTVKAVDIEIEKILEDVFHTCPPKEELWDGMVLIGTTEENELRSLGQVPYSTTDSKRHVLFEFVPSDK